MDFVTIREAEAACATIIPGSTREDREVMRFWIWLAIKKLGNPKPALKTCELLVNDLAAVKPDNYFLIHDLALIDSKGNDINYNYKSYRKRIHPITDINDPNFISVYEDESCFYLDSKGDDIEKLIVRYWESYPVDDNGDPKIPETHLQAIMMFVKHMYNMSNGLPYQQELYEWKILSANVRAQNKLPDTLEGREIMDNWMSLLPSSISTKYNLY